MSVLVLVLAFIVGSAIAQQCHYNGQVYEDGAGFKSSDGCNTCGCSKGRVLCTLMACVNLGPQIRAVDKPGQCPTPKQEGTFGICADTCSDDSSCEGNLKCCSNGCGKSCQASEQEARKSACPNGASRVRCLMAPCSVSTCDVEGAKCADNYCGGCNAIWTLNGARVCEAPKADIVSPIPSTPKSGFCPPVSEGSFGICTSTCNEDSDCEGRLKCCSNGCGKSCVGPTGGVKPARSCSTTRCVDGTECFNTRAGPRCIAKTEITQALADQQSTYASTSSTGSSGAEWVVVAIAAIIAVAFIALAAVLVIRLK